MQLLRIPDSNSLPWIHSLTNNTSARAIERCVLRVFDDLSNFRSNNPSRFRIATRYRCKAKFANRHNVVHAQLHNDNYGVRGQ